MSDQTKFRLNETNKIKDYSNSEIKERKTMSKKLSKYIATFDYIDKILIILSAADGGISITSFTSVIGIPAGIASASFTLIFFLTTGIIKKIIERNKKEKEKTQSKLLCDLVYKEIKGKFETDYLTEQQIKSIKDMDQNLLKASNLCMLMNAL